jgi:hypothetical protein
MLALVSSTRGKVSVSRVGTGRLLSSHFEPKMKEILELIYSSVLKSFDSLQTEKITSHSPDMPMSRSGKIHIKANEVSTAVLAYLVFKPFEFRANDIKPTLIENEIEFSSKTLHSIFNEGLPDGWLDLSLSTSSLVPPTIEMHSCINEHDEDIYCLKLMLVINVQGHKFNVIANVGFSFINTVHFFRPFINEFFLTVPKPEAVDPILNIKGFYNFSSEALRLAINPINAAISLAYQSQLDRLGKIFESLRIASRATGWDITYTSKDFRPHDVEI